MKNNNYNGHLGEYNKSSKDERLSSGTLFYNQIWRVKDVARYLGCTVGHVYNLVSEKRIPLRKKGRLLFFIPDEITNWILEGEMT